MLYVNSSIRTFVVLAIALSCFSGTSQAANLAQVSAVGIQSQTAAQIKSYREWKSSMISEAEARVKTLKENVNKSRASASQLTEAGLNQNLQNMQNMLDKEQFQYSLAQDLTITDYFVGYLTKQKSVSLTIKEVSGRLSAEEVAELMTAYADNFFTSKPIPLIQAPRADSGL